MNDLSAFFSEFFEQNVDSCGQLWLKAGKLGARARRWLRFHWPSRGNFSTAVRFSRALPNSVSGDKEVHQKRQVILSCQSVRSFSFRILSAKRSRLALCLYSTRRCFERIQKELSVRSSVAATPEPKASEQLKAVQPSLWAPSKGEQSGSPAACSRR